MTDSSIRTNNNHKKKKKKDHLPDFIVDTLYQLWKIPQEKNKNNTETNFPIVQIPKSAQQQVWIIRVPSSLPLSFDDDNNNNNNNVMRNDVVNTWQSALQRGNHHIVIRLWHNSCNWWNCNYQPVRNVLQLAQSETTAYRIAHQQQQSNLSSSSWMLSIPCVLYTSWENSNPNHVNELPWAIMEYVGPYSQFFFSSNNNNSPSQSNWQMDTSWIDSMIPIRYEYGYDEPHPRWGRIPVESCLNYGNMLLQQWIVPFHQRWQQQSSYTQYNQIKQGLYIPSKGHVTAKTTTTTTIQGFRYSDMIELYQTLTNQVLLLVQESNHLPHHTFFQHVIQLLQQIIIRLEMEAMEYGLVTTTTNATSTTTSTIPEACTFDKETNDPPCVPCHMDLQPQNLIVASFSIHHSCNQDYYRIVSVLDWEDAAYADCRFELLLVARKVLANRQQADELWKSYERMTNIPLGPIDPWLKLETTHSIITLLLQAIAGGGKNSWEQLDDIQNKIVRELERFIGMGWEFCSSIRNYTSSSSS